MNFVNLRVTELLSFVDLVRLNILTIFSFLFVFLSLEHPILGVKISWARRLGGGCCLNGLGFFYLARFHQSRLSQPSAYLSQSYSFCLDPGLYFFLRYYLIYNLCQPLKLDHHQRLLRKFTSPLTPSTSLTFFLAITLKIQHSTPFYSSMFFWSQGQSRATKCGQDLFKLHIHFS